MYKVIWCVCIVFVLLTGCSLSEVSNSEIKGLNGKQDMDSEKEESPKKSVYVTNEIPEIGAEILDEKSGSEQIVLRISNSTDNKLMFGEWFSIEKYEDGVWYQIPIREDIVFNSIGYPVEPNQTRELTFRFDYIYELETFQKYRIVTYFGDDNGDKHYVSDEFQIGILAN